MSQESRLKPHSFSKPSVAETTLEFRSARSGWQAGVIMCATGLPVQFRRCLPFAVRTDSVGAMASRWQAVDILGKSWSSAQDDSNRVRLAVTGGVHWSACVILVLLDTSSP